MDEHWRTGLTAASAQDMRLFNIFFTSFQWQRLVPESKDSFITEGQLDSTSYASSAVANDGSFALAYLPTGRKIDVDLTHLKGEIITAQWYDPTNGHYLNVAGSPFKRLKHRSFMAPKLNSKREPDFVLVLKVKN